MRRWIVLAVLCGGSAVAHADRASKLAVTGGAALMGDADAIGPDRLGTLLGASLAWQRPMPEMPEPGTARAQGQLVPEVGLYSFGDRGGVLAGVRLEADIAQNRMGLLGISARTSIWLAPRVGLVQGAQSAMLGGDVGESLTFGNWSVGYTVGMLTWEEGGIAVTDTPLPGGAVAFHAEPPGSRQIAVTFGLVVAR